MPLFLEYWFWLVVISAGCFLLERLAPWRRQQRLFRRGWAQDLFWLVFNGHYFGLLFALLIGDLALGIPAAERVRLLEGTPFLLQFFIVLVVKDIVEYGIHWLLHNVPFLWEFHKLHHSIEELDWIGNFRFHWVEVLIYKTLSYLPLVILGADWRVLFAIGVLWTVMLDLNHSNLNYSWGPLRYLLNSPRMHVWHHDFELHHRGGQNFGQVLSVWDWLFGTAYWPNDRTMPERLGFKGMENYPTGILGRLFWPLSALIRPRVRHEKSD